MYFISDEALSSAPSAKHTVLRRLGLSADLQNTGRKDRVAAADVAEARDFGSLAALLRR